MKLSEIIMTWHDLSEGKNIDQGNIFFKFIAIWIAFNGIYGAQYESIHAETEKMREFAKEPYMNKRHEELLAIEDSYRQAVKTLAEKGVIDMNQPHEKPYKINRFENFSQVVRCVYQVRNNLFHSGKSPVGNPRDEKLVDAAYTIVSLLIKPWLTQDFLDSLDKESHSAYEAQAAVPADHSLQS